jgi:hypothetical protein
MRPAPGLLRMKDLFLTLCHDVVGWLVGLLTLLTLLALRAVTRLVKGAKIFPYKM